MTIGTIEKYGYSDNKRGIEAKYLLKDKVLRVRIESANHWTDYIGDFATWPKVRPWPDSPVKFHPVWYRMAQNLAAHLIGEMTGHNIDEIRIMGHSMGGAVAAILLFPLPSNGIQRQTYLINAPKIGNAAAIRWLWKDVMQTNSTILALYDRGDIVHRLPLFYSRYSWNRPYAKTPLFEKAHFNFPEEWETFFE